MTQATIIESSLLTGDANVTFNVDDLNLYLKFVGIEEASAIHIYPIHTSDMTRFQEGELLFLYNDNMVLIYEKDSIGAVKRHGIAVPHLIAANYLTADDWEKKRQIDAKFAELENVIESITDRLSDRQERLLNTLFNIKLSILETIILKG